MNEWLLKMYYMVQDFNASNLLLPPFPWLTRGKATSVFKKCLTMFTVELLHVKKHKWCLNVINLIWYQFSCDRDIMSPFSSLTSPKTCQNMNYSSWMIPDIRHEWYALLWLWLSLFSTCRPNRDRQKPANVTLCSTLTTNGKDLLYAFTHRHDNTWMAIGEPVIGGGDKLITYW